MPRLGPQPITGYADVLIRKLFDYEIHFVIRAYAVLVRAHIPPDVVQQVVAWWTGRSRPEADYRRRIRQWLLLKAKRANNSKITTETGVVQLRFFEGMFKVISSFYDSRSGVAYRGNFIS